ncbi:MAG: CPBP family intramembrane metalloprotease [Bacteroidetes bacterium]|nr:CPBP family intramembrane metalloprotease [Bacteroidota bacterium]
MIIATIAESLLHILLLTPVYFLAVRSGNYHADYRLIVYLVIACLLSNFLLAAFSFVIIFPGQQYNWIGNFAAFLFELFSCFIIPSISVKKFGLTSKINWRGSGKILLICILYFLIRFIFNYYISDDPFQFHPEAIAFQATLPGLQEELLFRGILLALLTRIFPYPDWKLLEVKFGWPVIITSILFGLAYGLTLPFHFDIFIFLRMTLEGFLLGLLVRKTRNVFSAVVYHNLLSLITIH